MGTRHDEGKKIKNPNNPKISHPTTGTIKKHEFLFLSKHLTFLVLFSSTYLMK